MNKEELLKEIMKLPKAEIINPISTMNSINVDDLMSAVDRLNKVPNYDELLKENKRQREVINKAIEYIENCNPNVELHSEFLDESYLSNYGAKELLDILKEVSE